MKRAITISALLILCFIFGDWDRAAQGQIALIDVSNDPPKIISRVDGNTAVSSGTVAGGLEVDTLNVRGTLTVDGQIIVGGELGVLAGRSKIISRGHPDAPAPDPKSPLERWRGQTTVEGALIIHGPLVVHQDVYYVNELTIDGTMGHLCNKNGRLVFLPVGFYFVPRILDFKCPPPPVVADH
jgi:hypothetical protein